MHDGCAGSGWEYALAIGGLSMPWRETIQQCCHVDWVDGLNLRDGDESVHAGPHAGALGAAEPTNRVVVDEKGQVSVTADPGSSAPCLAVLDRTTECGEPIEPIGDIFAPQHRHHGADSATPPSTRRCVAVAPNPLTVPFGRPSAATCAASGSQTQARRCNRRLRQITLLTTPEGA